MTLDPTGAAGWTDCLAERRVPVSMETDVAEVLIAARALCTLAGATSVTAAHVTTAASELAHNLWLHATRGGTVTIRLVRQSTRRALTLEAADDGPGIADLGLAMTDGYSTAGGLGCGLPGAERLMDEFQIESRPGTGTRVRALAWLDGRTK